MVREATMMRSKMRSKPVFALLAAAAIGLMLIARGCSGRNSNSAATKVESADNAEAAAKSRPEEFSLSAEDDEGFDLPEREELRRARKLTPGTKVFVVGTDETRADTADTQVFVMGVNGSVKVEAADTDIAEVLVVRSARKREDLERQKAEINNDEDLFIRIGRSESPNSVPTVRKRLKRIGQAGARSAEDSSSPGPAPEIRQRVILRLPRKAGLEIRDVGGNVTVGEIGGYLKIGEVTGHVRVARAAVAAVVGYYITGDVDVTFASLNANVIRIAGVNGDVDLRFEAEVNADVTTYNNIGAIKIDLPNVETRESEPVWGGLKARIGKGGPLIEVNDVKGDVTLAKAAIRNAGTER
jgi:hypothetical protein